MANDIDLTLWEEDEFDKRLNEFKQLELEFQNLNAGAQTKTLEKIAIVLLHSPETCKEEYFQLFKRLTKYKFDPIPIIQDAFIPEMNKCVEDYNNYTQSLLTVPTNTLLTVLPDFRNKSNKNIAKMQRLLTRLDEFKKFAANNF